MSPALLHATGDLVLPANYPDPCGRRLSGDLSGFVALLRAWGSGHTSVPLDAITGINRADSASEKSFSSAMSPDNFG